MRITSLAVFAAGRPIRLYKYGVSTLEYNVKRAGTCSPLKSDDGHRVTFRALALVGWGSGRYNLIVKNCETVCHWCKVGNLVPDPRGRGGQLVGQTDPLRWLIGAAAFTLFPSGSAAAVIGGAIGATAMAAIADSLSPPALPPPSEMYPHDHNCHLTAIVNETVESMGLTVNAELAVLTLNDQQSAVVFADIVAACLDSSSPPSQSLAGECAACVSASNGTSSGAVGPSADLTSCSDIERVRLLLGMLSASPDVHSTTATSPTPS